MLTDHIPLPDLARGRVLVFQVPNAGYELVQHDYSNHLRIAWAKCRSSAIAMAAELNTRMAVAKKFEC